MSPRARDLLLLWRVTTLRHWRGQPLSHLFLVLLLGTGVASFFGVRLANRAATAGFAVFTDTLSGGPAASIESRAGPLHVSRLPAIRQATGLHPLHLFPVVVSAAETSDGTRMDVVGIDIVAARTLANLDPDRPAFLPRSGAEREAFQDALRGKRVLFPSPAAARQLNLNPGDTLVLLTEATTATWTLGPVLPPETDRGGPVAFADIRTLQEQTGRTEHVDRVEVFPTDPSPIPAATRDAVTQALPPDLVWTDPAERRRAAENLSAAFRLNLSALSLLALLVSLYLILQALDAAVARRREEIALLRSLGVAPRVLRQAWFVEALTLGVVGTLAGLVLGPLVARASVEGIAGTVDSLYVRTSARGALWSFPEALLAACLGLLASLASGWLPARDAALTPPAQILGRANRALPVKLLDHPLHGAVALVLGLAFLRVPPLRLGGANFPLFGYLAATGFAVGGSILACQALPLAAKLPERLLPSDPRAHYAASQLRHPSGRHKLAMAGLLIATAMAGGITLMVHSFRGTVATWLNEQLNADLFVSARGFQNPGSAPRVPGASRDAMLRDPDVLDRLAAHFARVPFRGQSVVLAGIDLPRDPRLDPERVWVQRPAAGMRTVEEDHTFVVSEPFARKFNLWRGASLDLELPGGRITGRVAGVVTDYANEHGTVFTSGEQFREWLGEDRVATLALHLRPGANPLEARDRLQAAYPGLRVRDQSALREEVFGIFNQTFSLTAALKGVGVAVAVAGLALSQISQFTERRTELGVLRELGFIRRDLAIAGAWESGLLTLAGALGGLTAALVLGGVLIGVVNPQSFGWTLRYQVPWGSFFSYLLLTLTAGALTGAVTGARAGNLKPDREE